MRIVAWVFCALFVVAAIVQWNDPDPILWIIGYLMAAVLAAGQAIGRAWPVANGVAAGFFAVWFLSIAPSLVTAESEAFAHFRMVDEIHEEPREAIGLALCAGWCGAMAWRGRRGVAGPDSSDR